jgi:hypothetical protein
MRFTGQNRADRSDDVKPALHRRPPTRNGPFDPDPSGPWRIFAAGGIMAPVINSSMNSLPAPALVAAITAIIALPFSIVAAGTLLITASLGFVIHADYVQRHNRVRLPRLSAKPGTCVTTAATHEVHPLAA